jgi:hypothetical protein
MQRIGIVALAAMLAGCASTTRGWNEQLSMASTPSGAEATVTGADAPMSCITPCVVQVPRRADLTVTFTKPGYERQVVPLQKEIATGGAAGFAGNLLLGGVVGMAVDGASGATLDHKPNPVIVTLRPIGSAPAVRRSGPRRKPATPAM